MLRHMLGTTSSSPSSTSTPTSGEGSMKNNIAAESTTTTTATEAAAAAARRNSTGTTATAHHDNISIQVDKEVLFSPDVLGKPLVGAIDQGTSSTRFVVFTVTGNIGAMAQMEHTQYFFPSEHPGWHEHDPYEIWGNVQQLMKTVATALSNLEQELQQQQQTNNSNDDNSNNTVHFHLVAIGITNQRETTVAWNKATGQVYYNAIVWDDTRTKAIVHKLQKGHSLGIDRLRSKTGLPLATYFAGTKVKWLLDHVEDLRTDLNNPNTADQVCLGTIDSWLLYQLTGRCNTDNLNSNTNNNNIGGVHCTDVTNASRWLFLDLEHPTQWDPELVQLVCAPHSLPLSALPTICPSSHIYGHIHKECAIIGALPLFENVPLASILGDQQAALFGQTAFQPGEAKNTYGTGLFLMMNTGTQPIPSKHGLLTTIAYQIGDKNHNQVYYALEGSVSHAGSTLQWLRDQLQIISHASQSEQLATLHNDGLYFVPAFAGLFAPHWRSDARACIVGMSASHHKGHIVRAALEAAAYQTKEVFDAIVQDSKVILNTLKVDGGMTHNALLMQFQADLLQVPVIQPRVMETTSIGAAFAAGLAVGVWDNLDQIKALWNVAKVYQPNMPLESVQKNWDGWQKAVTRSWDWALVQHHPRNSLIQNHDNNADMNHHLDESTQVSSSSILLDDDDDEAEGLFQDALDHISVVPSTVTAAVSDKRNAVDRNNDGGCDNESVPPYLASTEGSSSSNSSSSSNHNNNVNNSLLWAWQAASIVLVAGVAAVIGFEAGRASHTAKPRIK